MKKNRDYLGREIGNEFWIVELRNENEFERLRKFARYKEAMVFANARQYNNRVLIHHMINGREIYEGLMKDNGSVEWLYVEQD